MIPLAYLNGTILIIIALFHFYWALGGTLGMDVVFPDVKGSKKGKKPGFLMTIIAAILFAGMAVLALGTVEAFGIKIPSQGFKFGLPVLGVIFCARAIGDTKYVGFFKKYKDSKFAEYDTKYYSPLALVMGIIFFILFVMKVL